MILGWRYVACLVLALGASMGLAQPVPPDLPREARAVWVATVANIDWPSASGQSTASQQSQARAILDKCVQLKLNIVNLQVRPQCDALYPSSIEPWSNFLTGSMGVAPSPYYDPLQFWIDEAHKRGIELHAWLNPYRALGNYTASANHVTRTHPDWVRTYGSAKYLDPGHPEVPGYVRSVIADILDRYDVDGIHFDDYFYPYPISGQSFPDDVTYNAYLANGGTLSRANWRRQNVDQFVSSVYNLVKSRKPWVKFGISPFGIWRPGNPPGVTGLDAYADIYADSKKWLNNGWVDYFTPQLYWKISSTGQPYGQLLSWWCAQNWTSRHIWPGNFTSNIGTQYGDWSAQEILDQITVTRVTAGASGNVHFSMRALTGNWKSISDLLANGVYSQPCLVPASPWLDNVAPTAPTIRRLSVLSSAYYRITWDKNSAEPARFYVVAARYGSNWRYQVVDPSTPYLEFSRAALSSSTMLNAFAIAEMDRCQNLSAWSTLSLQ